MDHLFAYFLLMRPLLYELFQNKCLRHENLNYSSKSVFLLLNDSE